MLEIVWVGKLGRSYFLLASVTLPAGVAMSEEQKSALGHNPHIDVGKFDCRYLTRVRGFLEARLLGVSSSAFLLSCDIGPGVLSGVLNPTGLTIASDREVLSVVVEGIGVGGI